MMATDKLYKDCDGFKMVDLFDEGNHRDVTRWVPPSGTRFVVTYPKCGTTWTQMIVALLDNGGQEPTPDRLNEVFQSQPFLEFTGTKGVTEPLEPNGPAPPSVIAYKTHLPYDLQPKSPGCRYLYVVRNPKDTLISYYYHFKSMHMEPNLEFDTFFRAFHTGEIAYGDYYDNVTSWWAHRTDPGVTILTYEDMKRDPASSIRRIAEFMGPDVVHRLTDDPGMVDRVVRYSSIEYMKGLKDPSSGMSEMMGSGPGPRSGPPPSPGLLKTMKNMVERYHRIKAETGKNFEPETKFIRKGQVNDWKNHLTPEQNEAMRSKFNEMAAKYGIDAIWSDLDWL